MSEEQEQGGFPRHEQQGQDTESTTGDGHPPRPSEQGPQENTAGQGMGQTGKAGQQSTGGTGGYGGTSEESGS